MNSLSEQISDYIYKNGIDKNYYSVVVISDGDEQIKHYRPGNPAHDSYSVSKSITAIAAGILIDRGLISVSDKIGNRLGEFLTEGTDKRWADVTLDNVMRHRTGSDVGLDLDLSFAETWTDSEWLHTIFSYPIEQKSGEYYRYSDGNFYVMSRIIEKIVGTDLDFFLQKELFNPLGFHQNAWSRDVNGHTLGGTGLYMRTEDMAKIGLLCLNDGVYGDNRIISAEWAKKLRGDINDKLSNYGYGIPELSNGGFASCGMYGQGYYFNPKTRNVVAWHSFETEGLADLLSEIDK